MACPANTVLASAATNGYFSPDPQTLQVIIAQLVCDLKAAIQAGGGGGVPAGVIVQWSGTIATIPAGWKLCDGTLGTPDLRDKFIVGARQDNGGVAKTNLTGALTQVGGSITHNHNITDPGHTHTIPSAQFIVTAPDVDFLGQDHTDSGTTGITVNNVDAPQPYFALAYIMKT